MVSKRRIKSHSYYRIKSCLSKQQYTDSDAAARVAGYEALKSKYAMKIYKCPYGEHWHIAKWRPK